MRSFKVPLGTAPECEDLAADDTTPFVTSTNRKKEFTLKL